MDLVVLLRSVGRWTFRYFYIHAFLLGICVAGALPVNAQGLPNVSLPSPSAIFGIHQQGLYITAPVSVDGLPVIRIAELATGGSEPIDTRVLLVQNDIAQILAQDPDRHTTFYEPSTFHIQVRKEGTQYALEAVDDHHTTGLALVTVTSNDTAAFAIKERDLAEQWRVQLEPALRTALQKRQPANIRSNVFRVARLAFLLLLITVAAVLFRLLLARRIVALKKLAAERHQTLEHHVEETAAHAGDEAEANRRKTLALALRSAGPDARATRLSLYSSLLTWFVLMLWAVAGTWAMFLFPQTTATGQFIVGAIWRIVALWLFAVLIDRLLGLTIVHFSDIYAHRGATSEERARHSLRAPTISRAVNGFKTATILFIASLATLGLLNIPIASVVTIGGIAALAIGFAAQTLVKDVLNGMLVLMEDQYVVGDYVMVGDYNGIVENLTLRVLQLRDTRGYLVTIPHSAVTQVVNASRNWARVDFRIAIDPKADLAKAIAILRQTFEDVARSDAWRDAVIDAVEWVGVERVTVTGIVLRASMRTAPLRQFDLRRALNERVFEAYEREDIALGTDPLAPPAPTVEASPDPT